MNRELISYAMTFVDESFVHESMDTATAPGRAGKHHSLRPAAGIILAACLMLALAVSAWAVNFLGIREMLQKTLSPLPDAAVEHIQPQDAKASGSKFSCTVLETLSDSSSILAAVEVSAAEGYIIVPTDADPADPARGLGFDFDGSIGEYAKTTGKGILAAGATFMGEDAPEIFTASQQFEQSGDASLTILTKAQYVSAAVPEKLCCTVYVLDMGSGEVERIKLPVELHPAKAGDELHYAPVDAAAVPGLSVGEAVLKSSPLGLSFELSLTEVQPGAMDKLMTVRCEGFENHEGGFVYVGDGRWVFRITLTDGSAGESIRLDFLDENKESLGRIELRRTEQ